MRALAFLVCLAACAGHDPPGREKPGAPIDVALDARPLGGDDWELRLVGRARARLDGVELSVGTERRAFGAVAAGGEVELVARVHAPTPVEVVGGARVRGGGRATSVRLGAPRQPAALRVVSTPFGPVTEERP
jgi:hypothetical protein